MIKKILVLIMGAVMLAGTAMAADLSPGEGVYLEYCASCHGQEGNGRGLAGKGMSPPPRDFTLFSSKLELNKKRMLSSVTHGRPGTAMVPWDGILTAQEISDVVDYIDATFMQMDKHLLAGQTLYIKNCSPCHGDDGNSARWTKNSLNPPPRNFTTARARRELSRERMIESVTRGRPGTAMMPFRSRLEQDEIESVVDFIRASFMAKGEPSAAVAVKQPSVSPASPVTAAGHGGFDVQKHLAGAGKTNMALGFPKGLRGDFSRGRDFFMKNCFTCHGREGNGQGPRAKFIFPKPRNFHSTESKTYLNRPALFMAIYRGKAGTVMPAWGQVLDEQMIANIAEFVFQAFIQEKGVGVPSGPGPGWKKKQP